MTNKLQQNSSINDKNQFDGGQIQPVLNNSGDINSARKNIDWLVCAYNARFEEIVVNIYRKRLFSSREHSMTYEFRSDSDQNGRGRTLCNANCYDRHALAGVHYILFYGVIRAYESRCIETIQQPKF